MKLITLNIWGAKVKQPFIEFIKANKDTDIFCFQELYDNAEEKLKHLYPNNSFDIFSEIKELLPDHAAFFRPSVEGIYGIGIFIKKEIEIIEEGEIMIHPNGSKDGEIDGHHGRNLQWVKFITNQKTFTVANVHGLWNGNGKNDTPERISQSERIKEFLDDIDGPKILCGDFNLRPDTESLKMIKDNMHDLVELNNITSTRTSLYNKEEKFADYIFTSPEIIVNKFHVMSDEVSDHSPLFLDFSVS